LLLHDLLGTLTVSAPQPIQLIRVTPPILKAKMNEGSPKCVRRRDGPPPRQPSQLPPAGDLRLELALGKKAGSGASGLVYTVARAIVHDVSPSVSAATLPPLVVKVSIGERARMLLREASVYDEMECLQGVVVPRCFGYFEAEIDSREAVPRLSGALRKSLKRRFAAVPFCADNINRFQR
jgi:hypothetical protein